MKSEKKYNKELLDLEVVIGLVSIAMFFAVVLIASYAEMQDAVRIALIIVGVAFMFAIALALTKLEQIVGYYQCQECRHKYVPSYKAVSLSPHMCRTRYMSCPKCHKKSWQKKVLG